MVVADSVFRSKSVSALGKRRRGADGTSEADLQASGLGGRPVVPLRKRSRLMADEWTTPQIRAVRRELDESMTLPGRTPESAGGQQAYYERMMERVDAAASRRGAERIEEELVALDMAAAMSSTPRRDSMGWYEEESFFVPSPVVRPLPTSRLPESRDASER